MYKPIKFTETEDSRIYFTSDTHFYHDKDFVWGARGHKDVDTMNRSMIENWNIRVRPTDTVVHCGDFILGAGGQSYEKTWSILQRLNGNIIYLWGNHNAGVAQLYREHFLAEHSEWDEESFNLERPEYYPLKIGTNMGSFTFRGNNLYLQIKTLEGKKITVFCSHFAQRLWIDSHKDRIIHLCGHSHGSDPESQPDHTVGKRLDVGVDNFQGPINIQEVLRITNRMKWKDLDHHNKETNPS